MNNETKRAIALLEARVIKLEATLQDITNAILDASYRKLNCAKCGVYDPQATGFICSTHGCPQGLNPEDDE